MISSQGCERAEELEFINHMTVTDIKRRSRQSGNSPTEILFTLWGNFNHTILELFILLSNLKSYRSMKILKQFVNPIYHVLIKEDTKIKSGNVNHSVKILNVSKLESRENNESSIMENVKLESPHLVPQLGNESISSIPQVAYDDLKESTNNWDPSNILGKGGFGTVFKGKWKCTEVAIKKIELKGNSPQLQNEEIRQSMTELKLLTAYRHDNILSIYGYSTGGPQPCLIYQYIPGGCLESRLRVRDLSKVLKWPTRLSIAVGTARGLQFLHTIGDKPLVHGDIKSANILLDKDDTPRIGDFGLARQGPKGEYTRITKIMGTRVYLPDEYLRGGKLSTKVDTFCFGIVLFEIATALPPFWKKGENTFLKDHVLDHEGDRIDLKDPRAVGGESCFKGLLDMGILCVERRAKDRPDMVQVPNQLEKIE